MIPTIALDHLGAVDTEISPEERERVEMLIRREMDSQRSTELQPHQSLPLGGVDMGVYQQEDHIDVALSYAQLQERNLHLWTENQAALQNIQEKYLKQLEGMADDVQSSNNKKRSMLEGVKEARKRKQVEEYGPELEHLERGWRESIQERVKR